MGLDTDVLRERLQQTVRGRFQVSDLIGRGGFAAVYRAHDVRLARDVAIKVLDPELASSNWLTERFLAEARTIAALGHPGIVPIYEVEIIAGLLYLVMRFVPGGSLAGHLAGHGAFDPVTAIRLTREVAEALDYAHRCGIIHRDIKPDNILLDSGGRAVVTDFGIARALQAARLTEEGVLLGSPHYMSPEQAAGEDVDGQSDLYSLSVVLFEMLIGRPPFEGKTAAQILAKHISISPPALDDLRPELPMTLTTLVTRGLAKEPGQRFRSGAELSQALDAATTPVAMETRSERRRRLVRRATRSVGLATALAVLLVAAFIGGGWYIIRMVTSSVMGADEAAVSTFSPALPADLVARLQAHGLLTGGDTAYYLFVPHGETLDSAAFLVISDAVIRISGGQVRWHPKSAVSEVNFGATFGVRQTSGGWLAILLTDAPPDTFFTNLSAREVAQIGQALAGLAPDTQESRSR